jgi:hypothetical protein
MIYAFKPHLRGPNSTNTDVSTGVKFYGNQVILPAIGSALMALPLWTNIERCMFSPAVRFRVISPFVAFVTSGTNSFVTVPIGSIIATRQEMHDPGLVEIRLNDFSQPLLAFTRDIVERTEAVDERVRAARLGIRG